MSCPSTGYKTGCEYQLLSGAAVHTCTVLAHEAGRVSGDGKYTLPQIKSRAERATQKGRGGDDNATYHEVRKFLRLALKCNPSILELLWLD
ncbi:nucleotidyltransferase domain-containing protein [Nocardia abscessus]|uniref:nucleotidyltransferase domain-containing protein n=1 Tax=Nocardia abscessus TaxID=120957 RepID=UPI0018949625|nr:nucleotidyltransferase domain-containing protein [Nocardia abscessus]MBF6340828.1 nucleotidyltransferase domain-containing protein [Nocardia abscessus]